MTNGRKITLGWNLGDTLDAYEDGVSGETLWDNPKANQALFDGVKNAGFDIVRIPVTWMGHFGASPDFKIEEKFLQRLNEVTGMAREAGLQVIINMHHDGFTASISEDGNNSGWLSITKARKSQKEYNEVTLIFSQLWKQIAEYFENHGDWLMFESMNEIHDGNWGYDEDGELNITDELKLQFEIVNKWNQVFSDTVRAAGSNNASRYLIIPGYCTVPEHTLAPYFALPKDSVPGRQIVTFHYYDPYEFAIEGSRAEWGSKEDREKVDEDFAPFKEKYIDKGIPVIIGESGAVRQLYLQRGSQCSSDKAKEEKARQCRLDYISYVYGKAKEYGLVPIYWDTGDFSGEGEKFGLFDRMTGKPNSDESAEVLKAIRAGGKKKGN
ncbi:MAG: glycoside hydrolase family 5 protein [Treponema sp.]|nr:glycoside hydrolase family 5 protein [Treponema sp.]